MGKKHFYSLLFVLLIFFLTIYGCKDSIKNNDKPETDTIITNNNPTPANNINPSCPGECKTTCLPNEKKILCVKDADFCTTEKRCCVNLNYNCSTIPKYDANFDFLLDTCNENCVDMNFAAVCTNSSQCINGYNCCQNGCVLNTTTCCGDKQCDKTEGCLECPSDCGKCDQSTCTTNADCSSKYCVHGVCRAEKFYCGDQFCDLNLTEENISENTKNCPTDCCYSDCSSVDNKCHAECDNLNGCDFFTGCDNQSKSLFLGCVDKKTPFQCCQGFTKICDLNSYCIGGNCTTCSSVCDGKCNDRACCGVDPDCDLFGKVKGCTDLTQPTCIKGMIDPTYEGLCITKNTLSLSLGETRSLKTCCNGLFCDDSRQGCFDPDTSQDLCEKNGYIWKGDNCGEDSRCCGDDCFPTNCDYTC